MEELSTIGIDALDRYFKALTQLGYKSKSEVYKLLTILFLDELMESPMRFFISDKDT
jgi:hypothetical protein